MIKAATLKTFTERLKWVRKESSLTLEKFGSKLHVTKGFLSRLERGERNPTPLFIKAVSATFCIREEWLLSGTGQAIDLGEVFARQFHEEFQRDPTLLNRMMVALGMPGLQIKLDADKLPFLSQPKVPRKRKAHA